MMKHPWEGALVARGRGNPPTAMMSPRGRMPAGNGKGLAWRVPGKVSNAPHARCGSEMVLDHAHRITPCYVGNTMPGVVAPASRALAFGDAGQAAYPSKAADRVVLIFLAEKATYRGGSGQPVHY
jgi:hypothetical protein